MRSIVLCKVFRKRSLGWVQRVYGESVKGTATTSILYIHSGCWGGLTTTQGLDVAMSVLVPAGQLYADYRGFQSRGLKMNSQIDFADSSPL